MSPRRLPGPSIAVIWWEDIPAQVVARNGDETVRASLPARFQHAIDRAAMGGGQAGSDAYMSHWHREERGCSPDLAAEVETEVAALDQRHPADELDRLVRQSRLTARSDAGTTTAEAPALPKEGTP